MPICHNITSDGNGDDNGYHYTDDSDDGHSNGADPLAAAVPVGGGVSRRGGGIR